MNVVGQEVFLPPVRFKVENRSFSGGFGGQFGPDPAVNLPWIRRSISNGSTGQFQPDRASGRPTVVGEVELTIEAGAKFLFNEDAGIDVESGALIAEGTPSKIILMQGATETSGYWRGVSIRSKNPANSLKYVTISHGGSDYWDPCCPYDSRKANLNIFEEGIATIENVSLKNGADYGMHVAGDSKLSSFAFNSFSGNGKASLSISANNLKSLDSASDFSGPVVVRGQNVDSDGTWKALNTHYEVLKENEISIVENATITIQAGASFRFQEDAGLLVDVGVLKALGTSEDTISFKGTTQTSGWWKGIAITSPDNANQITYASIAHGGSDFWDPCCPQDSKKANVNVFEGGYLSLTHSTLNESANYATWTNTGSGSSLVASDNTYGGQPQGSP